MYSQYLRDRITKLRLSKNVSEYKMSYDLGHSKGYINNISSGKTLPSMAEFFAICEYFGISPAEFFEGCVEEPSPAGQLAAQVSGLPAEDRELIAMLIQRLSEK